MHEAGLIKPSDSLWTARGPCSEEGWRVEALCGLLAAEQRLIPPTLHQRVPELGGWLLVVLLTGLKKQLLASGACSCSPAKDCLFHQSIAVAV